MPSKNKKRRRRSGPRHSSGADPIVDASRDSRARRLLLAALAALISAQVLVPNDAGTAMGDGVVLVMLWLVLACGWCIAQLRAEKPSLRWSSIDTVVWVLIAWHTLSALVAFDRGSPRAAINSLWDWIAIGIGFFLVRQLVRSAREVRAIVVVMVGLAVGLSLLGFYQYFETMPADRDMYKLIKDDPQQMIERTGHWYPPGTPERTQFENRLDSSEPFASYSLANSLAGYLATWLVVLLGVGYGGLVLAELSRRGTPPSSWMSSLLRVDVLALPIVGCLLLTKSRAGYVAVLAGVAMLWLFCRPTRKISRRTAALTAATGVLVLSALIGLATFVGGLDQAVLTEAGKSLGYRWQYWQSSLAMALDNLWLGCGPGQFRDTYTAYKLPQASEEISDPHNFFMEIWATAGTPALVAMLVIVAMLLWRLGASAIAEQTQTVGDASEPGDSWTVGLVAIGAALGIVLGTFVRPLVGFPLDLAAMMLCLAGLTLTLVLLRGWADREAMAAALPVVAAVVLLVNLLAAGGIGAAGVAGSFWLLLALSFNQSPEENTTRELDRRVVWVAAIVAACLTITFYRTGYAPVLNGRTLIARASADPTGRDSILIEACEADPYSPDAARHLAAHRFARWQGAGDAESLDSFDEAQRSLLRLAPRSRTAWTQSGRWWSEIFDKTQDAAHLEAAIDAHLRAAELYPHSARVLAELAVVLANSDRKAQARETAEASLRQDDITRKAGHTDKLLSADRRDQLSRMIETPTP